MYRRIIVLAVLYLSLHFISSHAQETWVARDGSVKNMQLKTAIFNKDILYIATRSILYKTKDFKERWESVFTIPSGGNNEINCIAGRGRTIFVGTKRGLFRSEDYGASWKNVFRTILPDKNNITYIELSKHNRFKVLIGTMRGIFISEDLGNKWKDISGVLKDSSVKCMALNKELMYAGTDTGLYVLIPGVDGWRRAFVSSAGSVSEVEEPEDSEESEKDMSIRCISIDDGRVYIAYDKDILYSDDGAKSWNNFSADGIRGSINYILISAKNKKIYCATTKGVFEFSREKARWLELYRGMAKSLMVNRLIFAGEDEKVLFAVTDKGLYSFESGDYMMDKYPDIERSVKTLKVVLDGEPAFKELRDAAIKYAEVSPEKIKRWRSESRMSALLPKVSFSADRNSTDLWHWESGSSTRAGDDVLVPGRDSIDWGATLTWEFGNLIWNDDQTNIDVRSRLMVQLRNDILDDLRRIYYERKRLQFELISGAPKDMNAKFEKELRLQELTQAIDDLTGNYFSEHIKCDDKAAK
ncbi:MAG: hypothetical protein WC419_05225 [Candidatus Omnitrophota bacterium]|jgi:photosystem II stability/assembly factor-like uncharacterized protein